MFFKSPNLQNKIIPKNYPELEIQISHRKHFTVIGGKFKFKVQDSLLEYFFWKDLKNESHFLKKKNTFKKVNNPLACIDQFLSGATEHVPFPLKKELYTCTYSRIYITGVSYVPFPF